MRKTIAILDVFIKAQIIKTGGEIMDVISRDMIPLLISAKDAKQYLGISSYAFYKLIHNKEVPSVNLCGKQFLNRHKFFEFLDYLSLNH